MKRLPWVLLLLAAPAMAELPPPTPEEKAAFEEKAKAEAAMLERQERALASVQERIARQYRDNPPPKVREEVGKSDVPKAAAQPLGRRAAPHTDSRGNPQAEAHSQSSD